MASIREQIVAKVILVINTAISPVAVFRAPAEPLARNLAKAIVVDWAGEQYTPLTYDSHEIDMALRISVVARNAAAEQQADNDLVAVHSALMADRTLGGLALDILIASASKQRDDIDLPICMIAHEYSVKYRIKSNNIALQ